MAKHTALKIDNGNVKLEELQLNLNDINYVNISAEKENDVIINKSGTWVAGNLDDKYVSLGQTATVSRIYLGDNTATSDKYITARIGTEPIDAAPSLRFKIDDSTSKTGHWEFTNDGINWQSMVQSTSVLDVQDFSNVASNANVEVSYPSGVDADFFRVIDVYCKSGENYIQFPSMPDLNGVGFNVSVQSGKTIITNKTGETKDIRVMIQYMGAVPQGNTNDIINLNGLSCICRFDTPKSTNASGYEVLYESFILADNQRFSENVYIGLYEYVQNQGNSGNCRITISDGTNSIIKEFGMISNTDPKYTNVKLNCSALSYTNKRWKVTVEGHASVGGSIYCISRCAVRMRPSTILYEDYITDRNVGLTVSNTEYYQVNTYQMSCDHKITSNSYFFIPVDLDLIGTSGADLKVVTESNSIVSQSFINVTNSGVHYMRVKAPANISSGLISITLSAKVTSGSVKINSFKIFLEV